MNITQLKKLFTNHNAQISSIETSNDFYFQKAVDALNSWMALNLSPAQLDEIIQMNYKDFSLNDYLKEAREVLYTLISYCDIKAKDKIMYNQYEDKRAIAQAGIRQNAWVVQLCKYKKDNASVTDAISSMMRYIQSPSERLPIISRTHKEFLSQFLLSKEYAPETFDKEVIDLLSPYCHCINEKNNSVVISHVLYEKRDLWLKHPVKGLVARASDWPDELSEDMGESGYGCAWWHMTPVKGQDTIKQLRNIIKDNGYFEYYLVSNNQATHVAKVCDFAQSSDYEQIKESWKEKNPAWYCDSFEEYNDGTKYAKIVFLISSITQLDNPISINDFIFYKGASAPQVIHITPFSSIITNNQKIMVSNLSNKVDLLLKHKNIILQGAPGTGKTYSTSELAVALIEGEDFNGYSDRKELMSKYNEYKDKGYVAFTTFHQSMDYENFMEGLVPEVHNGQVTYRIKDGIFKSICLRAKDNPTNKFILVIDEINRGNISKIFGELITLLEKDKRINQVNEITVSLPYSGDDSFGVPDNLYIIGTMNTTDRSVGSIDYALRRRFVFETITSEPSKITDESALAIFNEIRAFIEKHKLPEDYIEDLMVGHSYFMSSENSDYQAEIKQKIQYGVIPLLKEYIKDGVLLAKYEDLKQHENKWINLTPESNG